MACWTFVIFSASSSGISHSNSSSSAITSSTLSSESAPRSSTKDDSFLMSASATPSCSATIFVTRASMLSIDFLKNSCFVVVAWKGTCAQKNAKFYHAVRWIPRRWGRSIHVHAAVHVKGGARDVRSAGRAQEEHRLRDVLHLPETPERHVLHQLLHLLPGVRARLVRLVDARRHVDTGYTAAAHLALERVRQAHHPRLGRRIVGLAAVAGEPPPRGDVHEPP